MEDGSTVPERAGYRPAEAPPDTRRGGLAVDRHRERGLDLTPEEIVARRHNRRLLVGVALTSITILVLALVTSAVYWGNEPSGPRISAPAGYKAVSDGYVSYVVPRTWATNPAFTDDAGDLDTSGPSGWAGEHRAYRFEPLVLGETPPTPLLAFGMPRPEPLGLVGGHPVAVKGAAGAFEYLATRPDGFRATVVDVLTARTGVEVWIMVQAPPAVTAQLVSSLQAY